MIHFPNLHNKLQRWHPHKEYTFVFVCTPLAFIAVSTETLIFIIFCLWIVQSSICEIIDFYVFLSQNQKQGLELLNELK